MATVGQEIEKETWAISDVDIALYIICHKRERKLELREEKKILWMKDSATRRAFEARLS